MRRQYNISSGLQGDLSLMDINGTPLSKRETSNCYVIKSTGTYCFPLVYGNAITNGTVNSASYTRVSGADSNTQPFYNYLNNQITSPFIETDINMMASSVEVLLNDSTSFTLSNLQLINNSLCTYVQFDVNSIPVLGGNITLGVKDSLGRVIWSWHLWAYPFTLTTKSLDSSYGYISNILDVNIGWVKHGSDSKYGTSVYYQWGRKDPMLRASSYTISTRASVAQGSFDALSCASDLGSTIQNPNRIYASGGTNMNWWRINGTDVNFYNFWNASETSASLGTITVVKTIYDPSPVGFHVPPVKYLEFPYSAWGSYDYGYTVQGRYLPNNGFMYGTASSHGSSIYLESSSGGMWSCNSANASYAYFHYITSKRNEYANYPRYAAYPIAPISD